MQRSKYDIWVGLFVMLGIVSVVFLALKVGNLVNLSFERTYTFDAQFSNIGGVTVGSPVKSAGVVVGRVRHIALNSQANQAIATLEMQTRYDFPIDSSLRIVTSGLLGEEYISIITGVESATFAQVAAQPNGTRFLTTRTQPSVALEELISQIMPGSNSNQPLKGHTYRINARFDNIGSIRVGSVVKSAGVVVGCVRDVSFDDQMFRAIVTLELESKYKFSSDSSFRIMSSGLIGAQYIDVSAGIDDELLEDAAQRAQNEGHIYLSTQTQSAIILEDLIGRLIYGMTNSANSSRSADGK